MGKRKVLIDSQLNMLQKLHKAKALGFKYVICKGSKTIFTKKRPKKLGKERYFRHFDGGWEVFTD